MSLTKRWLEEVSEEMGLDGEITPKVVAEAKSRQEVLDIQSRIVDAQMVGSLDEMYDEMAEEERAMKMYEEGLNTW